MTLGVGKGYIKTGMARVIKEIEIEGQPAEALFDTGAIYSYVRSHLVRAAPRRGDAVAVEEIGQAEGQELDALIGALTMIDLAIWRGHLSGVRR